MVLQFFVHANPHVWADNAFFADIRHSLLCHDPLHKFVVEKREDWHAAHAAPVAIHVAAVDQVLGAEGLELAGLEKVLGLEYSDLKARWNMRARKWVLRKKDEPLDLIP